MANATAPVYMAAHVAALLKIDYTPEELAAFGPLRSPWKAT